MGACFSSPPARAAAEAPAISTEALFFPKDKSARRRSGGADAESRLHAALGEARRTLDVCVFALSDGRLAGVLKAAARRGVRVRVLTDDEKRLDRGSKAKELEGVPGIELRDDRNSSKLMGGGKHADSAGRTSHMHHKFAVADGGRVLCTGSFNWTTSAVLSNYEDVLVLRGAQSSAGEAYQKRFDELWAHFA